jgi:hypothetical protein
MMFLAGLMMAIAVEHSGLHYRYQPQISCCKKEFLFK